MMPFATRDTALYGALLAAQVLLLGHLLQWSLAAALPGALLIGAAAARASHFWFGHARLLLAMFAAGGAGMLVGGVIDFGTLGLYGVLEICRSRSSGGFWPGLAELWWKVDVMPRAYLGMLVGGTAGMWLVEGADRYPPAPSWQRVGCYALCNTGMLVGMALAELAVARLASGVALPVAGALMLLAMLAGMAVGMGAVLTLALRVRAAGRIAAPP